MNDTDESENAVSTDLGTENVEKVGSKAKINNNYYQITSLTSSGGTVSYKAPENKSITKVMIKSKKLQSVGKKAIAGISKNTVIDVPGTKKKAYKKLFNTKTGFKRTMRLK